MVNHQSEVAYQIHALAEGMEKRAADLHAYAEAVKSDPSFVPRFAAQFGATASFIQIRAEVAERNKVGDTYRFDCALTNALADYQRMAEPA